MASLADDDFGPGSPRQFIALIPGGGWMTWCGESSRPVLAWALQADGDVVALEADDAGGRMYVSPVAHADSVRELWHPEDSSPQAQMRLREHQKQMGEGK